MSMSDDADRAGTPKQQGTGLKNPFASTGADPNGGNTGAGLPGLAAFGQMQAYTAQTPQVTQPQARQAEQPEEQYAQQYAPEPETPPHAETPAQQQHYEAPAEEAGMASAAQGYAQGGEPDQAYHQPQDYALASDTDAGAAESGAYSHDANGLAQPAGMTDLAEAYRGEDDMQTPASLDNHFTAEDLQSYMSGQAAEAPEAEETFDFTGQMALQPFEARYDQHPEVSLGSFDEPGEQPFFHQEREGDADFLSSEGEEADDGQAPPPKEGKSRRALMFASGLIGALALGGALAFAWKTGGDTQIADGGSPPLIKADDRPVKVQPEEPGGKQFAHQNKQIYDRLEGDQKPEMERLVPREETAAETPASRDSAAAPAAPSPDSGSASGAPHKVRTLKVMPDGSVVVSAPPEGGAGEAQDAPQARNTQPSPAVTQETSNQLNRQPAPAQPGQQPSVPALPAPGSEMAGVAVTMPSEPQPQQADRTTVASVPQPSQQQAVAAQPARQQQQQQQQQQMTSDAAPAPMPQPKPAAPERQTASASPSQAAPSASSSGSGYAVQVASRRSQAMALAAFADLQQKYTSLLGDYQPLIQSADLGDKGVWYRLRVGPIGQKGQADSLCNDLKRAGLKSCLVRPL